MAGNIGKQRLSNMFHIPNIAIYWAQLQTPKMLLDTAVFFKLKKKRGYNLSDPGIKLETSCLDSTNDAVLLRKRE